MTDEQQQPSMSRKIRSLDVETIRKIAAGEVIERPINVVKELVENSIDAEATEIIVELEKGGKTLIRVSDDGIGMSAEDLEVAWQRHTTSKITSIQDLNQLHTLGFRGEALYSIASVSRLRVMSRPRGARMGHELRVEAAKFLGIKPISCREGTIVEVRDLFFNFPVRKKFLRDDNIELAKIHEFLQNFSLGYPKKRFVLKHEGKLLFLSPRENGHKEAILRVHGKRFTQSLIDVKSSSSNWELEAYLMLPRTRRNKKKYLLTFVNGRLVSSELITRAVKEGFKEYLVKGDQPVAILFLRAPSTEFDINIHPSKKEIAFQNPNEIHQLVKTAVERALHDALSSIPIGSPTERTRDAKLTTFAASNAQNEQKVEEIKLPAMINRHEQGKYHVTTTAHETRQQVQLPSIPATAFITPTQDTQIKEDKITLHGKIIRIIGQLASSYLLLEDVTTNDLIIADQHALDERRRLKILKTRTMEETLNAEQLLAPVRLSPLPEERILMLRSSPQLRQLGIIIREDPNSQEDLLVVSLPRVIAREALSYEDLRDLLLDICEKLEQARDEPRQTLMHVQDHLLRLAACRGAIKFGKSLTHPEIKVLLESIGDLRIPFICAHGRPSLIVLPINRLHSLFRRRG